MSRIADSIRDYVSDNSAVTYHQLVRRFGTPEQIVNSYINEREPEDLIYELRKKRSFHYVFLISALISVTIWCVWVAFSYSDHVNDMNGYMVVEVIEVERIELEE